MTRRTGAGPAAGGAASACGSGRRRGTAALGSDGLPGGDGAPALPGGPPDPPPGVRSERALVRRLAEIGWKGRRGILLGPGDDAAVLRGGLVASTDLCVEGVHFRFDWISAREAGFRAAAAALSDLAAMGAEPACLLVSIALPARAGRTRFAPSAPPAPAPAPAVAAPAVGQAGEGAAAGSDREDGSGCARVPAAAAAAFALAEDLQRGAAAAGDRAGVPIAGGDVSRSPGPVVLDVVALGRAARPVARSGARPGDSLWVSGRLGGAAAAVAAWSGGGEPLPPARARFAAPPNRLPLGRALAAEGLATALVDVSDGLLADASQVAERSGVLLRIDEACVPLDAPAGADLNSALRGGEDYELMFTVPAGAEPRLPPLARALSVPLSRIGLVERGEGVVMGGTGTPLRSRDLGGHDHFAASGSAGRDGGAAGDGA